MQKYFVCILAYSKKTNKPEAFIEVIKSDSCPEAESQAVKIAEWERPDLDEVQATMSVPSSVRCPNTIPTKKELPQWTPESIMRAGVKAAGESNMAECRRQIREG